MHTVCGSNACDFNTIQAATEAAQERGLIKVATGVYTNVTGSRNPVIFIGRGLTLRGGYLETDFNIAPASTASTLVVGEPTQA